MCGVHTFLARGEGGEPFAAPPPSPRSPGAHRSQWALTASMRCRGCEEMGLVRVWWAAVFFAVLRCEVKRRKAGPAPLKKTTVRAGRSLLHSPSLSIENQARVPSPLTARTLTQTGARLTVRTASVGRKGRLRPSAPACPQPTAVPIPPLSLVSLCPRAPPPSPHTPWPPTWAAWAAGPEVRRRGGGGERGKRGPTALRALARVVRLAPPRARQCALSCS